MPRAKKHTAEEIIPKLRAAELEIAKGRTAAEAAKKIGVTEQTYYRWRKEYGGLRTDQAKRLKELEKENSRLKRRLADAELDKAICERPPRETSEPGEAAASSGVCPRRARTPLCDRTPGVPHLGTAAFNAASLSACSE